MASTLFFEEDEVSILTDGDGLRYGLVTESSEYFSSDDEDGDAAVYERLRKGTVRVSWHPDGQSQVITETELHLVDRALMPGDVVRRFIEGEDSQRGYVIMTRIMCHVQVTGKPIVICDVDSRDLLPISPFNSQPGDVYLDSWVGKVANILERVTVRFNDGARCEVTDEEAVAMLLEFTDVYDKQSKDSAFSPMVFYEGQVLKGDLGSFQDVKWLRTTRLHNKKAVRKYQNRHVNITIEKVETYQLEVNWICQGFSNQEPSLSGLQPPPRIIKGETLQRVKRLDCFEACNYKVGERALYLLKDSDTVITLNSKDRHSAIHQVNQAKGKCAETRQLTNVKTLKEKKSTNGVQMSSSNENNLFCDSSLKADIEETHLEETSDAGASIPEVNQTADPVGAELTPSQSKTSIDKKPKTRPKKAAMQIHQLKSKKLKPAKLSTRGPSPSLSSVKSGQKIPVEVIHTSTTVDIMWQDGSKELEIISTELLPVHHLDEHEFFPGDYVVSSSEIQAPGVYGVIQSVDHKGRMCRVKWLQHSNASSIDSVLKVDEVSVYDTRDHPDLKFRTGHVVVRVNCEDSTEQTSCVNEKQLAVGQVYELTCDGPLTIQWHDGSKSQCYPLQLYLIGDEMSDLYSDSDDSFSDENESSDGSWEWETEEETQLPLEDESNDSNTVGLTTENSNGLERAFLDHLKEVASRLEEVTLCLESKGLVTSCGKFSKYLLQFFRICVDFDGALGTTLFAGKELAAAMAELKRMSKKNKTSHSNKQDVSVRNPVEAQDQQKDLLPPVDESGNDSGLEKSPSSSELREMETTVSDLCISEGTEFREMETDVSALGSERTEAAAVAASSSVSSEIALKTTISNKSLIHADAEVLANGEAENDGKTENGEQKADDFKDSTMVDIAVILEKSCELLKRTQIMWQNSESEEKRLCLGALKLLCGAITSNPEHLIDSIRSLCSKANKKPLEEGSSSCDSAQDTACVAHNGADTADSPSNHANTEALKECSAEENGIVEGGENGLSPQKQRGLGLALSNTSSELVSEESEAASKTPLTPAEIRAKVEFNPEGFTLLESLPEFHHYKDQKHVPIDQKTFNSTIRNELKLLKSCLPNGIYVKGFESRMDLYSIMIKGPGRTPYEDGLFFFDVQLPSNYPSAPPLFFYISYCSDRLNPNLYEDGKVCVSLLGTWTGRGTEMWSTKSNLLQVLISIQGLILNPEPYYNEAGYERQKGTQIGHENSRMYNEMAIVKMVQSMSKIATNPFQPFSSEIQSHLNCRAYRLINRLRHWISSLDNHPGDLESSSAESASAADENSSNLLSTCAAITSGDASKSASSDCAITSDGSETQQKSHSEPSDLNNARLSKSDTSEGSVEAFSRQKTCEEASLAPAFPLLPASKGFKISLTKCLDNFEVVLQSVGLSKNVENS